MDEVLNIADPKSKIVLDKLDKFFEVPLVDLAQEDLKYQGVFTPAPEVNLPKIGVTEVLLSGAEEYFKKYQQYGYIYSMIKEELDKSNIYPSGVAVDFGSGFGNTVIPLLENFVDLNIIATDISPDLLAILRREAAKRSLNQRCLPVAMDSQRDYFKPGFADITFGCAMLHHMAEPEKVVRTALRVLKPGGTALFLEPFETGCSILRLAFLEILSEEKRRNELKSPGKKSFFGRSKEIISNERNPVFPFIEALAMDIYVRMHRQRLEGWHENWYNLDDKWLFSRSYFENIAESSGASSVKIHPLHTAETPFAGHLRSSIINYARLAPEALPEWGWEIMRRYDEEHFSPEYKKELIIEGMVVFTK